MTKRCRYRVDYDDREARFTDYDDAIAFARLHPWAEVASLYGRGRGLIGQFEKGTATPEFAHLDAD